jgi:hypothetical protein
VRRNHPVRAGQAAIADTRCGPTRARRPRQTQAGSSKWRGCKEETEGFSRLAEGERVRLGVPLGENLLAGGGTWRLHPRENEDP